ncbi:hypothetical protein [Yoonia sp. BS5-3]|uniref:Uncharacterized protein n=1 Tax=Yoonia phaeophyticola TaxID=3137369 RepID=A0ABZ2VBH5_9RHOB
MTNSGRRSFAVLLAYLTAMTPAAAQEAIPCDWQASAQHLVEPWEENSRTFANGDVRVAALDTIEPAAGFAYLMVLSPRLMIWDRANVPSSGIPVGLALQA